MLEVEVTEKDCLKDSIKKYEWPQFGNTKGVQNFYTSSYQYNKYIFFKGQP
jgi:hypothetical protein